MCGWVGCGLSLTGVAVGWPWHWQELRKSKIVKCKQQANVVAERLVLDAVRHPFIPRLYKTFRTEKKLYMLLELVQGGELFGILNRQRCLPAKSAAFYAACVLAALECLHMHSFLYRDVKPENVLMDAQGYAKLVDFGFAKRVPHSGRTYTLCGTPDYMAPELVMGRGYGRGADYWALGVLVYEMITGATPFSTVAAARQRRSEAAMEATGSDDAVADGGTAAVDGDGGAGEEDEEEDDDEGDPSLVVCKNVISRAVHFPKHIREVRYPPPRGSTCACVCMANVSLYPLRRLLLVLLVVWCSQDPTLKSSRRFVRALLAKDEVRRLGCRRTGVSEIKQHPFFASESPTPPPPSRAALTLTVSCRHRLG